MSTPLGEFRDAVCELHLGAGSPGPDQIRRRILGDHVPSAAAIRTVLLGPSLPPDIADVDAVVGVLWPAAVARMHELWVRAAAQRPPGRSVESLSPGELGVHRALGGTLPTYVVREHDHKLRAVVAASSGVAMLVGGSSSGKTRACYEALHALAGWRVWPAVHPTDPRQLLAELPQVGSRTVVWLDEAQRYLLDPPAEVREAIVAGLRALLVDETRGPVLILGTLWPRYWQELTSIPAHGEPATARFLLDGNGIPVPDTFSATDLAEAAATGEPTLVEAVEHAEDAAVTQYLAGAPDLLQRYELADQAQQAVIHAAMDARRLGHGEWLSAHFLHSAAAAFLDARTRRLLERNPHWFDEAMTALTGLGRADTSVLTPGDGGYRLEDYLDQLGRRTRSFDFPPQPFWDAVAEHVTSSVDLAHLGEHAMARFRLRIATDLFRRAHNNVATRRLAELAKVRELADHWDGTQPAAEDGTVFLFEPIEPPEFDDVAQGLIESTPDLADAHDAGTSALLAMSRDDDGDPVGAEAAAVRAAELGFPYILPVLAHRRLDHGDLVSGERLARLAVAAGAPDGPMVLAALTDDEVLARQVAVAGNCGGLVLLARRKEAQGDRDNALRLARLAVNGAAPGHWYLLGPKSPWVAVAELNGSHRLLGVGLAADGSVETVPSVHW